MNFPKHVFFSYARRDSDLRDALLKQLAPLRRSGLMNIWHDQQIAPGQDWKQAIDQRLDNADLILLLVTPDFLASDYCTDVEMTKALNRWETKQAQVVPIIARDCLWESSPISKLQVLRVEDKAVASHPDPNAAWAQVARAIRDLLGPIPKPSQAKPRNRPILLGISSLGLVALGVLASTQVSCRKPVISCGEVNPRATVTCKLPRPRPDHFEEDNQTRTLPFPEVRLDQTCPEGAAGFASFVGTCEARSRPDRAVFAAIEVAGRIGGRCGHNGTGGSGSVNPRWSGAIDLPSGAWHVTIDTVFRHVTRNPSCKLWVDNGAPAEVARPANIEDTPEGSRTTLMFNMAGGLHPVTFECDGLKDYRGCLGEQADVSTTTAIKYRLEITVKRSD